MMYLGASGGVLGGAAGDEFGVAVLQQVFVEAHVLLFGEDGVVGLDAVALEHGFISDRKGLVCGRGLEGCGRSGACPCPWISGRVLVRRCA